MEGSSRGQFLGLLRDAELKKTLLFSPFGNTPGSQKAPLEKVTLILCTGSVGTYAVTHGVSVETREQLVSASSLLPQYGFQGLNPACQVWHQALLPAEPSQQPSPPILLFSFWLLFLESGSPVAQAGLKLVTEDDLAF